ncbi:MAG: ORF6N domain-containing protein [Candidatus Binatia bacterium]
MIKEKQVPGVPVPLPTRIIEVRGVKVLLDADLAELYAVSTKALNQAIKRNRQKFPPDFMFRLTKGEKAEVVTNCDHLQRLKFSHSLPLAFTEHGALMAANVLNSGRAVAMSVYIIRAFLKLRETLAANQAILKRLAEIDKTLLQHDSALRDIYRKLLPLLQPPPEPPRRRIGFRQDE